MVPETENQTHSKIEQEAASSARPDEPPKTHTLSSLGRQSSIYSLTLDKFQNTFSENGKHFGSMNMDEFLTNIWTAEENQVTNEGGGNEEGLSNQNKPKPLHSQASLPRQGSLTLPAPLCRKTVDEVWSEINKDQQLNHQPQQNLGNDQPTFGEMTLEDFLIKAGVVRESGGPSSSHHQPAPLPHQPVPQQYGLYQSTNSVVDPNYGMGSVCPVGPVMSMGFSDNGNGVNGVASGIPVYQTYPQTGGVVGESSAFAPNGKRNGGLPQAPCFNGPVVGNGGGYAPGQPLRIGSPASPVSSDGMGSNPVENSGSQYGMDMRGPRGRKRIIDGPAEKVVERRQRRMIKNRESAARSRARKQAYTVELEAELNILKEENARLRRTLAELEDMMTREVQERLRRALKRKPETRAERDAKKIKVLRRTMSGPY